MYRCIKRTHYLKGHFWQKVTVIIERFLLKKIEFDPLKINFIRNTSGQNIKRRKYCKKKNRKKIYRYLVWFETSLKTSLKSYDLIEYYDQRQ